MKTLADILGAPHQREAVVADLVKLVETQVEAARGLKGMTLRTGLGMLQKARPDILPRAIGRYLPDFANAMEPLHRKFRAGADRDFSVFLQRHSADVAGAILGLADERVAASTNTTVKTWYGRIRSAVDSEIRNAVPALSKLLRGYL
ncbi:MAG TPA: hypothetical protein VFV11_07425 [Solimonas sp.]|nr:hypothetical protein [Solimonas sp.]